MTTKWVIPITRTSTRILDIEVEAATYDEAVVEALDKALNVDFREGRELDNVNYEEL